MRGSRCPVGPMLLLQELLLLLLQELLLLLLQEVVPRGWWGLVAELAQGLTFLQRARGRTLLRQVSQMAASVARYDVAVVQARFGGVV